VLSSAISSLKSEKQGPLIICGFSKALVL